MEPIKFKECNITLAEDQDEYFNLPAFKDDTDKGHILTCWNLSFWERLKILFRGQMWLLTTTFNHHFQPVFLTTKKSDVFIKNKLK